MNALAVQQLRGYLLNEQLPSEILLPKFIQALQIIFKHSQKFTEVSLDEWATLIENHRGKVNIKHFLKFPDYIIVSLILDFLQ